MQRPASTRSGTPRHEGGEFFARIATQRDPTPEVEFVSVLVSVRHREFSARQDFMHYAFDLWMRRTYPACPYERYADDAVVHCTTLRQADMVLAGIEQRMGELGLRLHPEKTRIVYCKDDDRRGKHEHTSFTFLGYQFRPRSSRRKRDGKLFTSFSPAISPQALKAKGERLHELRIDRHTTMSLEDLAEWLNPIIAGWMSYYGRYYRSALYPLLQRVNLYIRRWAARKYKRLRAFKRFNQWWTGVLAREPTLFSQWAWVRTCYW